MRKGTGFAGFVETDRGEVGAAIADVKRDIAALMQADEDDTAAVVTLPEPASPFAIYFRPHEKKIHKGCYGTFRALIPSGGIDQLRTVLQPTNPVTLSGTGAIAGTTTLTGTSTAFTTEIAKGDQIIVNSQTRIVDNVASATSLTVTVAFSGTSSGHTITAVRKRERLVDAVDVNEDSRVAGQVEYEFPLLLEWNVSYGLARLVAWSDEEGGKKLKNPVDEPDVGTYLATFSSPGNDPGTLTSLSLTITQDDSRRASVDLNLTQPAVPVALESVRLRRKIQGAADGTYVVLVKKFSMWTDDFFSVGAQTIEIADTVKTKPSKSYTWECRIKAIGGATTTFTQDSTGSDSHDVPARGLQTTSKNMIEGGAFMNNSLSFNGGAALTTDVGKNFRIAADNTSTRINNIAGGGGTFTDEGIGWDDANHRIQLATDIVTEGGKLCCRIRKQIIAGETYNVNFLIKAATLDLSHEYTVDLFDEGATAVIDGATQTFSFGIKSSAWRVLFAIFTVDSTYQQNGRQWLRVYPTSNPDSTHYIDNLCLRRGDKLKLWEPGDGEALLDSDVTITVDTGVSLVGNNSSGFFDSVGTQFSVGGTEAGIVFLDTAT